MATCYDFDGGEPKRSTDPRLLIPPKLSLRTRQHTGDLAIVAFCPLPGPEFRKQLYSLPEEPLVSHLAIQQAIELYTQQENARQVDHEALLIPGKHFRIMVWLLRFLNWLDRLCRRRSSPTR
jgi:hypothetical protein